jgi:hypothetical protein
LRKRFEIAVTVRGMMEIMKPATSEMIEGKEAFTRFENAMRAVVAVPRAVVQKRIKEHRKAVDANPNRRGPKRKVKPSASRVLPA